MRINSIKINLENKVRVLDLFAGIGGLNITEQLSFKENTLHIESKNSKFLWDKCEAIKEETDVYFPTWEEELIEIKPKHSYQVTIDIEKNKRLAKAILTQSIVRYFRKRGYPVAKDFIGRVEVWIKSNSNQDSTSYQRYTICPRYDDIFNGWQLEISKGRLSVVSNLSTSFFDNLPEDGFDVIVNHCVIPINKLEPRHWRATNNTFFPVTNRKIAHILGINTSYKKDTNKLANKYTGALSFLNDYICVEEFCKEVGVSISDNNFMELPEDKLFMVDSSAKDLLYGNNSKGQNKPRFDFKEKTPYLCPKDKYTFFFITNDDDNSKKARITLYNIMQFGMSLSDKLWTKASDNQKYNAIDAGGPIQNYLLQETKWEPNLSMVYSGDPIESIRKQITDKRLDPNRHYCALIISDIKQDDPDQQRHTIYFRMKELLMQFGICSQVIYIGNVTSRSFKYYMPNIAAALVGKMGGMAWSVESLVKGNDMIIGIGACKQRGTNKPYLGSAFCFDKRGCFKSFNCCQADDTETLRSDLKNSILRFCEENGKPDRLIIHYYKKKLNKRESAEIEKMLHNCGVKCPVYVVNIVTTINEDLIAFDTTEVDKMPISGTYVHLRNQEYLLYNNERYSHGDKADILYPIKLTITSGTSNNKSISQTTANDIITQVYQFCRLYCRSVKMQNVPITIAYPEIVARCVPYFTSGELSDYGRHHLWML